MKIDSEKLNAFALAVDTLYASMLDILRGVHGSSVSGYIEQDYDRGQAKMVFCYRDADTHKARYVSHTAYLNLLETLRTVPAKTHAVAVLSFNNAIPTRSSNGC